jgi:hypothetical protein
MSAGAWSVAVALVAVVGVCATAFGAWFTARAGRTASPYDALANRVTVLEAQRERDVAKIEAQHDEIVQLKFQRGNDQTEIAGLQRRVIGIVEDRDDLVRYLRVLQAWIGAGAKPPAPAVPEHLADVIPAWIPGDGAEIPFRRRRDADDN